ncbi:MAG: hypothetical protein IJQ62_03970 [Clostridia bacterium]|nr:hypothetical protein [Clostridia bacterium]
MGARKTVKEGMDPIPFKKRAAVGWIIFLAYFHRYGWIALVFPCLVTKKYFALGIELVAYSLWSLAGYLFRWKHMYCSYQNAYHTKMTPDHVNWDRIKISDAWGLPLIFGCLGLTVLLCAIFGN